MTFIRRFLSKFELKYDKTKKIKKEENVGVPKDKEKCNNPSIVYKNIQCTSSKVFASQNQLNNTYIVYEKSGSQQQVSDNEKENCFHNLMSDKKYLEIDEWNDKTSSIIISNKFKMPKLTPYQKKFLMKIVHQNFYLPQVVYLIHLTEITSTITLHSTTPGIYDLKPIAHSTPFQTPTHSLAKGRNSNKCRCLILPFEEKIKFMITQLIQKENFHLILITNMSHHLQLQVTLHIFLKRCMIVEDLGSVCLRQIKFLDVIIFLKLPIYFIVLLEIYAMKKGELDRTKLSRLKRKNTFMSINENNTVYPNDSLHPKNQIGFEHFTQCGILRLNRGTIESQKFYLEEANFSLEGTISLNTECSSLP
uniref:Actin-binding protein anillin (inferred by orthology to a human protein) n=1 Tax=Strongyloides venezuelensis TaxID=75913 RepID=A0A0K0F0R1_STRVS